MNGLKVNLHITERCNYKCKYCFAHFDGQRDLSLEQWKKIIDNVKLSGMVSAINFAGGEPTLYKNFSNLLSYAKSSGFELSLISNGSLLLNEKIAPDEMFADLSMLGISIDSFDEKILIALGCCDGSHKTLSEEKLIAVVNRAEKINPSIKIKINTVVSRLNVGEKLIGLERKISIDRWKFLKIKPFDNKIFSNKNLLIGNEEFSEFLERNRRNDGDSIPEQTTERSYIIIDNRGNLLDNFGDSYEIVGNLLEESFGAVFGRYNFDNELYQSRYA